MPSRPREQVLRSLVIELETVGLWRASVQSVCARAGVSKTTFYELFRNLPHAVERAATEGWLPEVFRAGMPALDVRGWMVRMAEHGRPELKAELLARIAAHEAAEMREETER